MTSLALYVAAKFDAKRAIERGRRLAAQL